MTEQENIAKYCNELDPREVKDLLIQLELSLEGSEAEQLKRLKHRLQGRYHNTDFPKNPNDEEVDDIEIRGRRDDALVTLRDKILQEISARNKANVTLRKTTHTVAQTPEPRYSSVFFEGKSIQIPSEILQKYLAASDGDNATASSQPSRAFEQSQRVTNVSNISNDLSAITFDNSRVRDLDKFVTAVGSKFKSKEDKLEEFLDRIKDVAHSYNLTEELILRAVPLVLDGPALDFFRLNRHKWATFKQVETALKGRYLDSYYAERLEDSVRARLQGPTELAADFITAIEKIYKKMPTPPPEKIQVERMYRNMREEFAPLLFMHLDLSVEKFCEKAEAAEKALHTAKARSAASSQVNVKPIDGNNGKKDKSKTDVAAVTVPTFADMEKFFNKKFAKSASNNRQRTQQGNNNNNYANNAYGNRGYSNNRGCGGQQFSRGGRGARYQSYRGEGYNGQQKGRGDRGRKNYRGSRGSHSHSQNTPRNSENQDFDEEFEELEHSSDNANGRAKHGSQKRNNRGNGHGRRGKKGNGEGAQ